MNGHDLGQAVAAQLAFLILIVALVGMAFGAVIVLGIWWLS